MTDSMKFGPEWLRNMADSGNPQAFSSSSNNNNNTPIAGGGGGNNNNSNASNMFCHSYQTPINGTGGGGGGAIAIASGSSASTTASTQAIGGGTATATTTTLTTPRNILPEFRYGREEMLSLFDKNCNIPEILPTFKKIFVEKVQFPLALTPTTDEEMLTQAGALPTQRPVWMQRSPVGFSNSARGGGSGANIGLSRLGLSDRGGRMRGGATKPIFHSMFQRGGAVNTFDDDLRSMPSKSERAGGGTGWLERNGGSSGGVGGSTGGGNNTGGGDSPLIGAGNNVAVPGNNASIGNGGGASSGISGPDWTPTSSPRKEFGSMTRNMENWRRQRNEDGSGGANSSGNTGNETNSGHINTHLLSGGSGGDGWRNGPSTNFGNSHRWGRSTSWRDEDDVGSYANSNNPTGGSMNSFGMQRSYSTIATTATGTGTTAATAVNERSNSGYFINVGANNNNSGNGGGIGGSASNIPGAMVVIHKLPSGTGTPLSSSATASMVGRHNSNTSWTSSSSIVGAGAVGGPLATATSGNNGNNMIRGGCIGRMSSNNYCGEPNDDLPEWAMENTTEVSGGTFDSTGAFHGSGTTATSIASSESNNQIKQMPPVTVATTQAITTTTSATATTATATTMNRDLSGSPANAVAVTIATSQLSITITTTTTATTTTSTAIQPVTTKTSSSSTEIPKGCSGKTSNCDEMVNIDDTNIVVVAAIDPSSPPLAAKESVELYTDLMKEVADDMVEKLIMDDETIDAAAASSSKTVSVEKEIMGTEKLSQERRHHHRQQHNAVAIDNTANGMLSVMMPSPVMVAAAATSNSEDLPTVFNSANRPLSIPSQTQQPLPSSLVNLSSPPPPLQLPPPTATIATMPAGAASSTTSPSIAGAAPSGMSASSAAAAAVAMVTASSDLWYYRDPQSKVQGPFSPLEMAEWYRAGYFNENLYVRRGCDTRFRPLGELTKICHGQMPFTHSFLIPPASIQDSSVGGGVSSVGGLHYAAVAAAAVTNAVTAMPPVLQHQQHVHQQLNSNPNNLHATSPHNNHTSNNNNKLEDMKVKNLFNAVDMSNILNLHFKNLQEQYSHHHERLITTELAAQEWFQRMPANERETIIRQRMQSLDLPDYLTNLSALGQSLATRNPAAYMQLYDSIRMVHHHQQQQQNVAHLFMDSESSNMLALNSQEQKQEGGGIFADNDKKTLDGSELLDDYDLRMFGTSIVPNSPRMLHQKPLQQAQQQHKNFLNHHQQQQQQHDFDSSLAAANNSGGGMAPFVRMWLPTINDHAATEQQQQLLDKEPQQHQSQLQLQHQLQNHHHHGHAHAAQHHESEKNPQWSGPLVGIPSAVMNHSPFHPNSGISGSVPFNGIPITMAGAVNMALANSTNNWCDMDVGVVGGIRSNNDLLLDAVDHHNNHHHHDDPLSLKHVSGGVSISVNSAQQQHQYQQQGKVVPQTTITTGTTAVQTISKDQQTIDHLLEQSIGDSPVILTPSTVLPARARKDEPQQQNKAQQQDKYSRRNSNNLVANNNNNNGRKTKEDESRGGRNTESAEEKRKQKEERKRQQHFDEEKRRQQLADEEKRRHQLDEKERQMQIQMQRRKAMMNNGGTNNSNNTGSNQNDGGDISIANVKQQLRMSSIAPWSLQTTASTKNGVGPSLAEIQKAERRERRADQQQRQSELLLEKQSRANQMGESGIGIGGSSDINKWNASHIPVKSLAEIQAEESRRLVAEQIELQRRKEMEQAAAAAAGLSSAISLSGGNVAGFLSSNNNNNNNLGMHSASISAQSSLTIGGSSATGNNAANNFWGNSNKIWGNNTNNALTTHSGFWEDNAAARFSTVAVAANTAALAATASTSLLHVNNSGMKLSSSQQQQHTAQAANTNAARNLRKSQTMPVMQSAGGSGSAAANSTNIIKIPRGNVAANVVKQQTLSKGTTSTTNQSKEAASVDKRSNPNAGNGMGKNAGGSGSSGKGNGGETYENEFTMWCTKSLYSLTTKVDVPTFVTFLQDLESSYEVKDYIRMYLGESKEFVEFAKQFLERRSRYKNLQRAQNAHNDDMCKPAPAITPASIAGDNSDHKGKMRKVKKNKMTKLDARILGFSVTAAEGRINVGDRDYVDAQ